MCYKQVYCAERIKAFQGNLMLKMIFLDLALILNILFIVHKANIFFIILKYN